MSALWDRFKWVLSHASWLLAALIIGLDPRHIDNLVERHPEWAGIIMALWAMLLAWANKPKSNPPPPNYDTVYPPGTGADPIPSQYQGSSSTPSSFRGNKPNKPYSGGLR